MKKKVQSVCWGEGAQNVHEGIIPKASVTDHENILKTGKYFQRKVLLAKALWLQSWLFPGTLFLSWATEWES